MTLCLLLQIAAYTMYYLRYSSGTATGVLYLPPQLRVVPADVPVHAHHAGLGHGGVRDAEGGAEVPGDRDPDAAPPRPQEARHLRHQPPDRLQPPQRFWLPSGLAVNIFYISHLCR